MGVVVTNSRGRNGTVGWLGRGHNNNWNPHECGCGLHTKIAYFAGKITILVELIDLFQVAIGSHPIFVSIYIFRNFFDEQFPKFSGIFVFTPPQTKQSTMCFYFRIV